MELPRVGIIGVGVIGGRFATRLLQAGYPVTVVDKEPQAVRSLLALGAVDGKSAANLAAQCEIIILALPDSQVNAQVMEQEGVLAAIRPNSLIMDIGTSLPQETERYSRLLALRQASMVDAANSFGPNDMWFMVGASPEDYARVAPLLALVGNKTTHVGPVSHGHKAKLVQNLIRAVNIAAVAEGFALAASFDLDPLKVWESICGTSSQSFSLDTEAPRMAQRNFSGKGQLAMIYKDIGYILESARDQAAAVPLTSLLHEIFRVVNTRYAAPDWAQLGIVTYWEHLNGVQVCEKNQPA